MMLFNSKLADVIEFREVTYYENIMVRRGHCEVNNIYSIAELQRRGFVEVKPMEQSPEEPKAEINVEKQIRKPKKARKPGRPKKVGVKN